MWIVTSTCVILLDMHQQKEKKSAFLQIREDFTIRYIIERHLK